MQPHVKHNFDIYWGFTRAHSVLQFILWAADFKIEYGGIEHGWRKGNYLIWFCDDGGIEVHAPETKY